MKFQIALELAETNLTVEAVVNWVNEQECCTMEEHVEVVGSELVITLYSTFDEFAGFAEAIAALGEMVEEHQI